MPPQWRRNEASAKKRPMSLLAWREGSKLKGADSDKELQFVSDWWSKRIKRPFKALLVGPKTNLSNGPPFIHPSVTMSIVQSRRHTIIIMSNKIHSINYHQSPNFHIIQASSRAFSRNWSLSHSASSDHCLASQRRSFYVWTVHNISISTNSTCRACCPFIFIRMCRNQSCSNVASTLLEVTCRRSGDIDWQFVAVGCCFVRPSFSAEMTATEERRNETKLCHCRNKTAEMDGEEGHFGNMDEAGRVWLTCGYSPLQCSTSVICLLCV